MKDEILKLIQAGHSLPQIAILLGKSLSTIKYHLYDKNKDRLGSENYKRIAETRKQKTRELKLFMGGKCQLCHYDKCLEALDFHHIDPSTKVENLSNLTKSRGIDALKLEAAKCLLICSNCHREFHAGIISLSEVDSTLPA